MAAAISERLAQEGVRTAPKPSAGIVVVGRSVIKVKIVQCCDKPLSTMHWRVPCVPKDVDALAIVLMDENNQGPMDYYCFSREQFHRFPLVTAKSGLKISAQRCASFTDLLSRCRSLGLSQSSISTEMGPYT